MQITFVQGGSDTRTITATSGQTLMEAALANGIDGIEAQCGGSCACGTCHVWVDATWTSVVGSPGADETDMLQELDGVNEQSRLSCQIRLTPEY